jgi:hypothetical protein
MEGTVKNLYWQRRNISNPAFFFACSLSQKKIIPQVCKVIMKIIQTYEYERTKSLHNSINKLHYSHILQKSYFGWLCTRVTSVGLIHAVSNKR